MTEYALPDAAAVSVDLEVTSTADLQAAIDKIQTSIKERGHNDIAKLTDLLGHVDSQLTANHGSTVNGLVPHSIEHLELYLAWLHRIEVEPGLRHEDVSQIESVELGPDLHDRIDELRTKCETMIREHPLTEVGARSGDREGNADGSAYFKVPAGRRRQMLTMLYCNLFTGPTINLLTIALIWLIVPYGNYMLLAYVAWITYENFTRKMPTTNRISQSWRNSRFYSLVRDYFPIRMLKSDVSNEFDASKNYLFCYHPHGVQSAGAFSFSSNATGFDQQFPGLSVSVQTLGLNFKLPITRAAREHGFL